MREKNPFQIRLGITTNAIGMFALEKNRRIVPTGDIGVKQLSAY